MASTHADRLRHLLLDWRTSYQRERLAHWRGDPDAIPRHALVTHSAHLLSSRTQDLYHEAMHTDEIGQVERQTLNHWLREAAALEAEASARSQLELAWQTPINHDSDFHHPAAFLQRIAQESNVRRRRDMADACLPFFEVLRRTQARISEIYEAAEAQRHWLPAQPSPPTKQTTDPRSLQQATDDLTSELIERISHTNGRMRCEHWSDLAFILRASNLDNLYRPNTRWRRVSQLIRGLGLEKQLERIRAERQTDTLLGHHGAVLPMRMPSDIRVATGPWEAGLASEREATQLLIRGVGLSLSAPALPFFESWPTNEAIGFLLGALAANLYFDAAFIKNSNSLDRRTSRHLRECALLQELIAQRSMLAQRQLNDPKSSAREQQDRRIEALRDAWRIEIPAPVADAWDAVSSLESATRLTASLWAPALHVHWRNEFNEDFWRNPRITPLFRAAFERGNRLQIHDWIEETGLSETSAADFYQDAIR